MGRISKRRAVDRQCAGPEAGLSRGWKGDRTLSDLHFEVWLRRRAGQLSHAHGDFYVSAKLGDGLPAGAVIKSRVPTGEIVKADAPGRDAIVSRVIWLRGTEPGNRNACERCIYISWDAGGAAHRRAHIGTHLNIVDRPLEELLPEEGTRLVVRDD